ncbi:hypothetical protein P691DRAFT_830793 [Macrolepiota fuliginosa MF-IS2]|uniref:G domain-containing protein n=1 Tax=Macrolepiota fuliginosa MF-IS2 TaxID=1400762 RepID=A0A9P5X7X0_9AGAR|nr:hypothetical protein P691DRAFT_830793 [Macrolepiota fuliginosa MF-IS2]
MILENTILIPSFILFTSGALDMTSRQLVNNALAPLNVADVSAMKEIRQDDIIIAIIGPSGSGRSYLVDLLSNRQEKLSQGGLSAGKGTSIQPIRIQHPDYGDRIVLLDTPGFDASTNGLSHVKLTGLLYLQQITNTYEPYQHETLFKELCGDISRTILMTTMWHEIRQEEGEQREQDLTRCWQALTNSQATAHRLGDEPTSMDGSGVRREAWDIIIPLITRHDDHESILFREDLAALQEELCKSQEGKELWSILQDNLVEWMKIQKKWSQALKYEREQGMLREFEEELRDHVHEVVRMKGNGFIDLLRRILSWPCRSPRRKKVRRERKTAGVVFPVP